jgi:hypothetical protein
MKKCLCGAGTFANNSVFIPSFEDIEAYKEKQRRLYANEKNPAD